MKFRTLFSLLLLSSALLSACGPVTGSSQPGSEQPGSSEESQLPEWVDYTHNGSIKLELEYKDRDFYADGIGQVTLGTAIDGDTAHFDPVVTDTSDDRIKGRFFGIDTPESTGKVQEYGGQASDFTKEKLKKASQFGTIVVSSPQDSYGVPQPDSTGSRYVSLIWINEEKKNAPIDELYLLNLWIVQEGLSWVKNVNDMPQYVDVFYAAEQQARDYKLKLHSGEPDPDFNYGGYETTSLLDIKREVEKQLEDPDYVNAYDNEKVRVVGTVAGYQNNILYITNFYTQEEGAKYPEGEYAGINIFCGMTDIPSKYQKLNTYIEVSGLCKDSENFGFQITDAYFPRYDTGSDNQAKVLIPAADNTDEYALHTFEYTTSELNDVVNDNNYESINCRVQVEGELECRHAYKGDSGDITLYFNDVDYQVYITFTYIADPNNPGDYWTDESRYIGEKFSISGIYSYHKKSNGSYSFQVIPNGASDLVWSGAGQ